MVPPGPTARPFCALAKATACRRALPAAWRVQLAPPSTVRSTRPPSPTAQARWASNTATPRRVCPLPASWATQSVPALLVRSTVPPSPTAQPVLPARAMARRWRVLARGRRVQLAPPSVLTSSAPSSPAIQTLLALAVCTASARVPADSAKPAPSAGPPLAPMRSSASRSARQRVSSPCSLKSASVSTRPCCRRTAV